MASRHQLCSRSGTGNRPIERVVIAGPFGHKLGNGFTFESVVVMCDDDQRNRTRSLIETRTGWRLGRISVRPRTSQYEEEARALIDRRITEVGADEIRNRIMDKHTLACIEVSE